MKSATRARHFASVHSATVAPVGPMIIGRSKENLSIKLVINIQLVIEIEFDKLTKPVEG